MINKNKNKTVVLGLSGGVDSAVSAALLKKQGYNVIAVFMQNWDSIVNNENNYESHHDKCDAQIDFDDAKKVADFLNIPLYKKDFIKEYWDNVFVTFLNKYSNNLTPNPDILCNQYIKFQAFLEYAIKEFNADYIATGHYAKLKRTKDEVFLIRNKDDNKDQTYFLCNLNKEQLSKSMFPLANLTKPQVRKLALKFNLPNATKKDSTGICFIGERNLKKFLSNYVNDVPGDIIDITTNKVVGKHDGSSFYTLGQRKGLNLSGMNEKYFVAKKENNTIYVAPDSLEEKYLQTNCCKIKEFNWIFKPNKFKHITARFRHRQALQKVDVTFGNNNELIIHYPKQKNITPGQFCVLYQNKKCLGGGEIVEAFTE